MGRISSEELVGRTAEMALLAGALGRAQGGQPAVTILVGEAGVGKTRLVREHARAAEAAGALALTGDCVELSGGEAPYAPIGGLLRQVQGKLLAAVVDDVSPRVRSEIAHVFGDLAGAHDDPAAGRQDRFAQTRLFGALQAVLARLAEHAPLVIVIEDIQWADASSRDFLRYLVHNTSHERLSLALTVRSDALHGDHPARRFVADLCRDDRVARCDVEPLSRDGVRAQLAGILRAPPSAGRVDAVFARSQGNPLYTEELAAAGLDAPDRLPASLRDSLLLRVEALSRPTQEVLELIAALGRPARAELVGAACRLSEPELEAALTEAIHGSVLASDAASRRFEFRHALLREAVYEELLPFTRKRVHGAIASALETLSPAELAGERAVHWEKAGDAVRALRASIEAGLSTERVFAYREALVHFERARRLWDAVEPALDELPLDWVDVTSHAAEAARLTGAYDRAVRLGQEALDGFEHELDPERAARLYGRLGRYQPWNTDASLLAYERALALLPAGAAAERARLTSDQALTLSFKLEWDAAREKAQAAIALAREAGARAEEGSALVVLGVAHAFLGDSERGEAELREGLRLAAETADGEDLCRGYVDLGDVLRLQGRVQDALAAMSEGEALAGRLGAQESFGAFMAVNAAEDLLRLGRWDEAQTRLDRLASRRSGPTTQLLAETVAGRLDARRGQLDDAREHFERALALCVDGGPPEFLPALYAGWAEAELWRGDLDAARLRAGSGIGAVGSDADVLNGPALFTMAARVEAEHAERARALGDRAAVATACAAAEASLRQLLDLIATARAGSRSPAVEAALASCRAEVARARGDVAPQAWREVAAAWGDLQQPDMEAYACLRHAEAVLLARGDREAALTALRRAYRTAAALGAAPLLESIGALGRRARLDPAAGGSRDEIPAGAADAGLTRREVEVLQLLADGLTNRQIADRLFISPRTADVHVAHILSKLGASNRLVAAATAERLGLLVGG